MRRVFVVLLVAFVMPAVAPATPAAAKTDVEVPDDVKEDGGEVTITVPIDCYGCKGKKAPDGKTDLASYWEQTAEKAWNNAFKQWSYCNKYVFKLDVDIEALKANGTGTEGRHSLRVKGPPGWDGIYEPTPGGPPGQRSTDGTRYYKEDGKGRMPANATPSVINHEIGHVIGLGDDRDENGNALAYDITLMVGGATLPDGTQVSWDTELRIDKNLVDRIGKQLANLGKIEKCRTQSWKGPIRTTYMASIEGVTCTAEENGAVTLGVVGDEVSGTIEASGSETCTGPGGTITEPTAVVIRLTGTFEDREFELRYSEVVGEHALTPTCLLDPTIDIPVERGTGSTELVYDQVPGYMTTCNITVEREADDDEPVG